MVWTGVLLDGHALFHRFERDIITDMTYRGEILESNVLIFRGAFLPELKDVYEKLNRALLINEFLERLWLFAG